MTLEEFRDKYDFAANMSVKDLKRLFIFIMILLLDARISDVGKEKSSLENFFDDISKVAKLK